MQTIPKLTLKIKPTIKSMDMNVASIAFADIIVQLMSHITNQKHMDEQIILQSAFATAKLKYLVQFNEFQRLEVGIKL
jgi:hypothetical protein